MRYAFGAVLTSDRLALVIVRSGAPFCAVEAETRAALDDRKVLVSRWGGDTEATMGPAEWRRVRSLSDALLSVAGRVGAIGHSSPAGLVVGDGVRPNVVQDIDDKLAEWARSDPVQIPYRSLLEDHRPEEMPGWPLSNTETTTSDLVSAAYLAAMRMDEDQVHVHVEGGGIQSRACGAPQHLGQLVPPAFADKVSCPRCLALIAERQP